MTKLNTIQVDLLVIGGGINGAGIACDAQGRGLKVVLCEAKDLASATSSYSSKLIHGGLRYLEQYEFKLVREALKEREVLLNKAPHIIQPLSFILPYAKHLRPKWMIRIGLFLYDNLAPLKSLHKSRGFPLSKNQKNKPLKDEYTYAFSYSDCKVDDARLVILNALQAQKLGARIFLNTSCISAKREGDNWIALLESPAGPIQVKAKGIVNATGPWVSQTLKDNIQSNSQNDVKLVQGSHIIVPKLYEGTHAYILQNKDNRIVFTIPYGFELPDQNKFTLIGTTDTNYRGDPRNVKATTHEIDYLCQLVNEYFKTPIMPEDVIWQYSGVRPLYNDHSKNLSKVTREYHFELEDDDGKLPLLSVFGGKLTTYRTLAEAALEKLEDYFPKMGIAWTDKAKLPGGDEKSLMAILIKIQKQYPWLSKSHAYRYALSYGTLTFDLLDKCKQIEDLGEHFGHNLYEVELNYLVKKEWAFDLYGIIWLRSKLGLWLSDREKEKVQTWLDQKLKKPKPKPKPKPTPNPKSAV